MPSLSTSSSDGSPAAHLRRALIFGLGVLALLAVLDRIAGFVLDRWFENSRAGETAGLVNLVLESAQQADVIIFGSSRARHHYDPAVIETQLAGRSVFNAGASGQSLPYARVVQRLLYQRGARPDCVVLHLDVHAMYAPVHGRVASLRPYAGQDREADSIFREQIPWFDLKRHVALWRYNSMSLSLLMNIGKRDAIGQGFEALTGSREVLQQPEDSSRRLGVDDPRLPMDAQALEYLGRIVTDAQAHGAKVVLLSGPRHDLRPDGRLLFNPHRDFMREDLTRAAATWGVPYTDVHEREFPALQAADLWADSGHLNAEGATAFSEIAAGFIASGCAAP
ncbi:MAG: hypothetical protein KGO50_07150 [Myxococcales bacterium]|nr:hypothetical protein [Myxococcales bacterium]